MSKDSLKFFQSYIRELADIGGKNLPRAVSTKLGIKLGKIYRGKDAPTNLEASLRRIYKVLDAKPKITNINGSTLEVLVKHQKRFCPIGGSHNPERADFVTKNICIPYTLGFLHELEPDSKFEAKIKKCIVSNHTKYCNYILKIVEKSI